MDQLGRWDTFWKDGSIGEDLESMDLTNVTFLKHDAFPVKMSSPYWLYFIEHNNHFMPLEKLDYNWKEYIDFSPPSVIITDVNITKLKKFTVTLHNVMKDEDLFILEIYSYSRELFLPDTKQQAIKPDEKLSISIFYCLLENDILTPLIFFKTNKGTFPYYVEIRTVEFKKKLRLGLRQMFYHSSLVQANLSLNLIDKNDERKISVVFDSSIFDPRYSQVDNGVARLSVNENLKTGLYLTFINVFHEGNYSTFPLFLSVGAKYLQGANFMIILAQINNYNHNSAAPIQIINPTSSIFKITSFGLAKGSPSNLEIQDFHINRIMPNSVISIGTIILHGYKEGTVEANIIVSYETKFFNTMYYDTLEIPVRGSVFHGYVNLMNRMNKILIKNKLGSRAPFKFKNFYSVPIVVLGIFTDTKYFKVINYEPCLIQPNDASPTVYIECVEEFSSSKVVESNLFVRTNASDFQVTLVGYIGGLKVAHENSNTFDSNVLFIKFGKMFIGSTGLYTIHIMNENLLYIMIREKVVSSGISLDGHWQDEIDHGDWENVKSRAIEAGKSYKLSLKIHFEYAEDETMRNDTITLMTEDREEEIRLIIEWEPVYLNLTLETNLNNKITFGMNHDTELYISQTSYNENISVSRLYSKIYTTLPPGIKLQFDLHRSLNVIQPGVRQKFVCFNFLVECYFIPFDIYRNYFLLSDFNALKRNWMALSAQPYEVEIDFCFVLSKNTTFIKKTKFELEFKTFDNITVDIGYIEIKSITIGYFEIENVFDLPLKLEVHGGQRNDVPPIPPHEKYNVPFKILPSRIGTQTLTLPVTTNSTPPFVVFVNTIVTTHSFDIIDSNGYTRNPMFIKPNIKNINNQYISLTGLKIKNTGLIPIGMIEIETKERYLITNNIKNLKINEAVEIDLQLHVNGIKDISNEFLLVLSSTSSIIQRRIIVKLDENSYRTLNRHRMRKYFTVVVFASILPLYRLFIHMLNRMDIKRDYDDRMMKLEHEVDKLSVSLKSSVGIQTSIQQQITGGQWIRAKSEVHLVTPGAISDLIEALRYI